MTPDGAPPARANVRVAVPRLAEGERSFGAREARYLVRVHRLRAGDGFAAFDPERGVEADGEVVEVTAAGLIVRLGSPRPARLVAAREVTWLQALPKGEKMDDIVRDATELGATRIVPATTAFTVVKLEGARREARRLRWERIAGEAARQCGRSDPPVILAVTPWVEALAVARPPDGAAFCLHERATTPLGASLQAGAEGPVPLAFAAGPEGGLSDDEVDAAALHGFEAVTLGPFVLRAETVAAATLGALRALEGATSRALR
jgi:16S rRNA (uracil1498-N3)-methyltransferase